MLQINFFWKKNGENKIRFISKINTMHRISHDFPIVQNLYSYIGRGTLFHVLKIIKKKPTICIWPLFEKKKGFYIHTYYNRIISKLFVSSYIVSVFDTCTCSIVVILFPYTIFHLMRSLLRTNRHLRACSTMAFLLADIASACWPCYKTSKRV